MEMRDKENELYKRVDEILHYLWDPIGISAEPGARDEYSTYAQQVFNMLMLNMGEEEIVKYLEDIIEKRIDLTPDIANCQYVTEVLLNYKEFIMSES